MVLTPREHDVMVINGPALEEHWFEGPIIGVQREPDAAIDGGFWIILTCEGGGQIQFFSSGDVMFVEPDRH